MGTGRFHQLEGERLTRPSQRIVVVSVICLRYIYRKRTRQRVLLELSGKMNESMIERGIQIASELSEILRKISDKEVGRLLGEGAMNDLMNAILDPSEVRKYPNIAEFLLANKSRASLLALVRYAITMNYVFKAGTKGKEGIVSPHFVQWYEDGVMFLEGQEPFVGLIGLYRNGEESFRRRSTRRKRRRRDGQGRLRIRASRRVEEKNTGYPCRANQ